MTDKTSKQETKGPKPLARIVAYRHYKDDNGETQSVKAEVGAVWPTKNGDGQRLSFKFVPAELLTGECQLYLFNVEDKSSQE